MKTKTFSIITPSYNQGSFIEETIRSVISQEGDFYLEYFIIDGGSTDESVEIIMKYERALKNGERRVRCRRIDYQWVSEADRGQADALSKGFRKATGEVLAWINSDDVYCPGSFKRAAECFEAHPEVGFIYGKSRYISKDGVELDDYPTGEFDIEVLPRFNFIAQPSVFMQRDAYFGAGGVDVGLSYALDYELWIRIAKRHKTCYVPEVFSGYRLHDESKTVAEIHALKNAREILNTVVKHFGWAPVNRVYGYTFYLVKSMLPSFISDIRLLTVPVSVVLASAYYLVLNRGIRRKDISLLNSANFKKLLGDWRSFKT